MLRDASADLAVSGKVDCDMLGEFTEGVNDSEGNVALGTESATNTADMSEESFTSGKILQLFKERSFANMIIQKKDHSQT